MVATHAGLTTPAKLERAVLFGTREIDAAEQSMIDARSIQIVDQVDTLKDRLRDAPSVYAHLDMDVHDALTVRVNGGPVPSGPDIDTVRSGLVGLKNLKCLAITGLDPAAVDAAKAADVAIEHVLAIAQARA